MKNARMVVLMFVAAVAVMSHASAQEVQATGTSHGLKMYEPAADSGPAEQPSAVESGARKVGAFFGNLVKAPVRVAKALAGGVSDGYSQPSNASGSAQSQNGAAVSTQTAASTPQASASMSSSTSRTPQEMRQRITQMFARVQGQAAAPVEDRSVSASASTSKSNSANQLSAWKE